MHLSPVPVPQPPDSAPTPATTAVHISIQSLPDAISSTSAFISCYFYRCVPSSPGNRASCYIAVYSRTHWDFFHSLFTCPMPFFYLYSNSPLHLHLQYPSPRWSQIPRATKVTLLHIDFPRMAFASWKENGTFILLILFKLNILQSNRFQWNQSLFFIICSSLALINNHPHLQKGTNQVKPNCILKPLGKQSPSCENVHTVKGTLGSVPIWVVSILYILSGDS